MTVETKSNPRFYNVLSVTCGTWFLLTGWLWAYYANLFISFPFGLIGIFFWYKGREIDPNNKVNRAALVIHIAGGSIGGGFVVIAF